MSRLDDQIALLEARMRLRYCREPERADAERIARLDLQERRERPARAVLDTVKRLRLLSTDQR